MIPTRKKKQFSKQIAKIVFVILITFQIVGILWIFKNGLLQNDDVNSLADILFSNYQPRNGKSFFFLETSNAITKFKEATDLKIKLNARQACAIESAAKMNPENDIFVLFVAGCGNIFRTDQSILKSIELTYSNVHFRKLNLWTFVVATPIFEWFKSGKLFDTIYPASHISDFLRYLILWRWGGTYLDLDVIILKCLENIPPNYACSESDDFVASGIMNFAGDGFGHEVAELCLRDFQNNFDGNQWGNNGPGVITRVLQMICKTQSTKNMTRDRCNQFTVYPKETFYAIGWDIWEYLFDPKHLDEAMEKIEDSLIVHAWNGLSASRKIKVGSSVAYGKLAEQYCPKVYASCGDVF